MKEFKFRAYHNKEIVYPTLIGRYESETGTDYTLWGCACEDVPTTKELFQFIGETDNDGVEIYVGDIVEYGYQSTGSGYLSYIRPVIQLDDGRYCMGGDQIQHNPCMTIIGQFNKSVKIIGKIHQNPELLEQ